MTSKDILPCPSEQGYITMHLMRTVNKVVQNLWLWVGLALLAMIGLKIWLVMADRVPFNADEAIVALMARHILQGERPVFFYGQAYMGSLDAFLVAIGFIVFGQQVWVIRLVQGILYLGTMVTTAILGRQVFASWKIGVMAMLLLAIPTVNVTLYTTASLGGYGEALLLGNLMLIVTLKIYRGERNSQVWWWLLLGLLTGIGVWAFGLTLVYTIPALIFLLWSTLSGLKRSKPELENRQGMLAVIAGGLARSRREIMHWSALVLGGLIGGLPWLVYAIQNGFANLIVELGGGAIAGVEKLPWIFEVGKHLGGLLLLGATVIFGFRPPWCADWLGLPLLPFVLILWMMIVANMIRNLSHVDTERHAKGLLLGMMLTLMAAFVFTPFGADPSGRYFVPLAIPMTLFAAACFENWRSKFGRWIYAMALLLVVYHLWGILQSADKQPPGITTQFYTPSQVDMQPMGELISFLHQQGETRGYTNYWVAYPLAFQSQETLIYTPRLPYHLDFRHTERDNRYLPYHQVVEEAAKVAYITTHHPALDDALRNDFAALGVSWKEQRIGDFQIFYALSRLVRPEELSLPDPVMGIPGGVAP